MLPVRVDHTQVPKEELTRKDLAHSLDILTQLNLCIIPDFCSIIPIYCIRAGREKVEVFLSPVLAQTK